MLIFRAATGLDENAIAQVQEQVHTSHQAAGMMHNDQAGSDRLAGDGRDANPRRVVAGNTVFFPMATVYAIFVLPASVFAMLGLAGAFPALASTTGHAHEMLFAFALAVVAGNQLGPIPMPRLAAGRYQAAALHIITVGALGTLTLNIMAMTWTLKARQDPSRARVRVGATIFVGMAALARALAGLAAFDPRLLLVIASTAWSSAFAMLLVLLVRLRAS